MNEVISTHPAFERIISLMFGLFIVIHCLTCLWWRICEISQYIHPTEQNWIMVNNLQDETTSKKYVACLYIIVQSLTTVGYGDMTAQTAFEKQFVTLLMLAGCFFYAFIIGSISQYFSNVQDPKQFQYKQKMQILSKIKDQYFIDFKLYEKIKNALYYGTQQIDWFALDIFNDIPYNLKIEVMTKIYKEVIGNVDFFQNRDFEFLETITPLFRQIQVPAGEYIFMEGDPAYEMFFIQRGEVSVVIPFYDNFKFLSIKEGYFFGELDLLFHHDVREYTYMAEENIDILVLNRCNFKKIFFEQFREIGEEIAGHGLLRKKRLDIAYKNAINLCKRIHQLLALSQIFPSNKKLQSQKFVLNQEKRKLQRKYTSIHYQEKEDLQSEKLLQEVSDKLSTNLIGQGSRGSRKFDSEIFQSLENIENPTEKDVQDAVDQYESIDKTIDSVFGVAKAKSSAKIGLAGVRSKEKIKDLRESNKLWLNRKENAMKNLKQLNVFSQQLNDIRKSTYKQVTGQQLKEYEKMIKKTKQRPKIGLASLRRESPKRILKKRITRKRSSSANRSQHQQSLKSFKDIEILDKNEKQKSHISKLTKELKKSNAEIQRLQTLLSLQNISSDQINKYSTVQSQRFYSQQQISSSPEKPKKFESFGDINKSGNFDDESQQKQLKNSFKNNQIFLQKNPIIYDDSQKTQRERLFQPQESEFQDQTSPKYQKKIILQHNSPQYQQEEKSKYQQIQNNQFPHLNQFLISPNVMQMNSIYQINPIQYEIQQQPTVEQQEVHKNMNPFYSELLVQRPKRVRPQTSPYSSSRRLTFSKSKVKKRKNRDKKQQTLERGRKVLKKKKKKIIKKSKNK